MKRYIIYWAHYPHETDIRTEGYVGMTSSKIYIRRNRHRTNSNEDMVSLANDKNAIWKIMYEELSYHEACMIEEFLRPHRNIGYNKEKGGNKPTFFRKQRNKTRNVVKPYKCKAFFIDDIEFRNKQDALKWLIENNICSARTAQRRMAHKTFVPLDEFRNRRYNK